MMTRRSFAVLPFGLLWGRKPKAAPLRGWVMLHRPAEVPLFLSEYWGQERPLCNWSTKEQDALLVPWKVWDKVRRVTFGAKVSWVEQVGQ